MAGKLLLSFDYLDQNDGFVVQLLHTGEKPSSVKVVGSIKGAPPIAKRRIKTFNTIPLPFPPSIQDRLSHRAKRYLVGTYFFALFGPFPLVILFDSGSAQNSPPAALWVLLTVTLLFMGWYGWKSMGPSIPRGLEIFASGFEPDAERKASAKEDAEGSDGSTADTPEIKRAR